MNYYRVEVETEYAINDEIHCDQQTFYLASSREADFGYIRRVVDKYDADHVDILVEKMEDNEKF